MVFFRVELIKSPNFNLFGVKAIFMQYTKQTLYNSRASMSFLSVPRKADCRSS